MTLFYALAFFVLGTIVGSFLNVVILRLNTGRPIVNGRSICFSCGRELGFTDLIPVVSFLFLRGKCKSCKSKISWQYPAVEFSAGLMFMMMYLGLGFSFLSLFYVVIWSLLIVIFVYDIHHKIIPDIFVYSFSILALANILVRHLPGFWLDIISGVLLFAPFALIWWFSRGKWMGFGDAKLALGIGWLLGFSQGISAIILGFWIGGAFSLIAIAIQKIGISFGNTRLSMKSEMPFAPFLILATAICFFFGATLPGFRELEMFILQMF